MTPGARIPVPTPDGSPYPSAVAPRGDGLLYLGGDPVVIAVTMIVAMLWVAAAVAVHLMVSGRVAATTLATDR